MVNASGVDETCMCNVGHYNIDVTDTDIPPEVSKAVEPAAEKIFRSFMRWFEKEYLAPRGNGGHTGGCFGFKCASFGRPQGMHGKAPQ